MFSRCLTRVLACVAVLTGAAHAAPRPLKAPAGMVMVGPGVYRPLYPASPAERLVSVRRFYLDAKPVTNGQFLAFVRSEPEWRRDRAQRLLADAG